MAMAASSAWPAEMRRSAGYAMAFWQSLGIASLSWRWRLQLALAAGAGGLALAKICMARQLAIMAKISGGVWRFSHGGAKWRLGWLMACGSVMAYVSSVAIMSAWRLNGVMAA